MARLPWVFLDQTAEAGGIELWQNHLSSFALFLENAIEYLNWTIEKKKYSIIINVPEV